MKKGFNDDTPTESEEEKKNEESDPATDSDESKPASKPAVKSKFAADTESEEESDEPATAIKKKSKFADSSDENEDSDDKEGGSTDSDEDLTVKKEKFQRQGNLSLPMILVGTKMDEFELLSEQFHNLSSIEIANRQKMNDLDLDTSFDKLA